MKTITLAEILESQDLGKAGIDKISDAVLGNTFDYEHDPITGYIVKTFESNNYSDYESMSTDLAYAISQLKRAKDAIDAIIN